VTSTYRKPLVFVTVGGDHHPFDRLMQWVERWLSDEGDRVRCVVQYGTALPPAGAECFDYLDHDALLGLMESARAVVSSGGPTTLLEARRLGHRPVVVPRRSSLGEHVDDHQRLFAARLHTENLVVRAEDEPAFRDAVHAAIDAPRIVTPRELSTEGVMRIGRLIDETAGFSTNDRTGSGGQSRDLSVTMLP